MKTLLSFFAIILVSILALNAQNIEVSYEEISENNFDMVIENMKAKYVFSAMKSQVSAKNLTGSAINFAGQEITLTVDTVTYTNASGREYTKKVRSYSLNGFKYTKIGELKKSLSQPTSGKYTINNNTFDFDNNSVSLTNQTRKQVTSAVLRTVNVRLPKGSKAGESVEQTITLFGTNFTIKCTLTNQTFTNTNDANDSIQRKVKVWTMNGVQFEKISEIKTNIREQVLN